MSSPRRPMPPLRLIPVPGPVPEDVTVRPDGTLVTALRDSGQVLLIEPDSGVVRELGRVEGQPLGVEIFPDGRVLVCAADRGLVALDPATGRAEPILERVDGVPFRLCNNATIARDGTIYVSESSRRYDLASHRRDLVEGIPSGRLIRRAPDGRADVLLDGLAFANGVTLSPDESFVLVAETGGRRIRRVWLAGTGAGSTDVFAGDLPGMPDNLSTGTDGLLWVAIAAMRNRGLEALHRAPAIVRRGIARIVDAIEPAPPPCCAVLALDFHGALVHELVGDARRYRTVTGVREHHGCLYLGTIASAAIAAFDLREAPAT